MVVILCIVFISWLNCIRCRARLEEIVQSWFSPSSSCDFYRSVCGLLPFVFYDLTCFFQFMYLFIFFVSSSLWSFPAVFFPILFTVIDVTQDDPTLETKRLYSPSSDFNAPLIDWGVKGTACREMRSQQLGLQMTDKDGFCMSCFFFFFWNSVLVFFCVLLMSLKGGRLCKSCLQTEAPVDVEMSAWLSGDDVFRTRCPNMLALTIA